MHFLILLVALVLGGFAVGGSSGEQSSSAAARPSSRPPPVSRVGPPPAWVETERGSFWLGYAGDCWKDLCIKSGPTRRGDLPPVIVRKGEVVRFHLGFRPRRVLLAVGRSGGVRLVPARTIRWRIERAGRVSLLAYSAREGPGGSAGYFAVFRLG
jgi:hypothetical protein